MRKIEKLLPILIACFIHFTSIANLSIEGNYQGKSLYVQNPQNSDGFGYCVKKVTVNGKILPSGISQSAFEIDFSIFKIAIGEKVFIVVEHSDDCKPKIINPEVLLPQSTFFTVDIAVTTNGFLSWKTTNEQGKLPFIIEQFRWNKWVQIGEVQGKGTTETNSYEFQIVPHSGENSIRVVQIDNSGQKRASRIVKFQSTVAVVEKNPVKVKNTINFTSNGKPVETKYEIYDAYGNIVKKGVGSSVPCSNLSKGAYYLNFDNKTEKFFKN
ncbi:MAG: hypothetical protein RLZZ569_46 [Bacteroidota bacterium]|jgi:hypothetical protein